jgi:DNA-binding CsgD family transcriptional regulator
LDIEAQEARRDDGSGRDTTTPRVAAGTGGNRLNPGPTSVPGWMGESADRLIGARDDPGRLRQVMEDSALPMVLVDGERRYVEINTAARLALGLTPRATDPLRVDDLTPPYLWPVMEAQWERLMRTGCIAGPPEAAEQGYLGVSYFALANALPGLHLIAFAPAGWPERRVISDLDGAGSDVVPKLTPRELDVLRLAAEGHTGPMIAATLFLSTATVKTHFANIYRKLDVSDRAAAVAKAMRLRLIA